MSGKKFVRISLILTTVFLVFIAAVNIVVDTFFCDQSHRSYLKK